MESGVNVVFFGHHKCGSRFFRSGIMAPLANANGYDIVSYKVTTPPFHFRVAHDLDLYNIDFDSLKDRNSVLVNLSNAGSPVVERICQIVNFTFKGIHVIRDPRQVFVSSYFHHRAGHDYEHIGWVWDQLKDDRQQLQTLPEEEGLMYELDHISKDVFENQLFSWKPTPNILEIRLEEFDANEDDILAKLMKFCGFSVPVQIDPKRKNANPDSRNWRDVFTPIITAEFKARYGNNLIRLGYEADFNW